MQFFENDPENAFHVLANLIVPEAQDLQPLPLEISGPGCILSCSLTVLSAIKLDSEISLPAQEIADEGADRDLTGKLESAELPSAKMHPE